MNFMSLWRAFCVWRADRLSRRIVIVLLSGQQSWPESYQRLANARAVWQRRAWGR